MNIRLDIEYDGSGFHGWQEQPDLRTVQGELHRALETVLREKIPTIYSAGRTDAGVHAKNQVVHFLCETAPDLGSLKHSVSGILRGEVAVLSAVIVPDDFHARRSSKSKVYKYTILNRQIPPVLDKHRVWHVSSPLDVEVMKREAKALCGKYDFKSFQGAGCSAYSTVKEILESEVIEDGPTLYYEVRGSGFLKQMVRNIVGTLVGIGQGSLSMKTIQEVLSARDRTQAGITAPAQGLCLERVYY